MLKKLFSSTSNIASAATQAVPAGSLVECIVQTEPFLERFVPKPSVFAFLRPKSATAPRKTTLLKMTSPMRFVYGPMDELTAVHDADQQLIQLRWWFWEKMYDPSQVSVLARDVMALRREGLCISLTGDIHSNFMVPLERKIDFDAARRKGPVNLQEFFTQVRYGLIAPNEHPDIEEGERSLVRSWRGTFDAQYEWKKP
jgi:hypothetical protein